MNALINWNNFEKRIAKANELKTIGQMQEQLKAFEILVKQTDGSLLGQNRCSKYRIMLERRAGAIYEKLPDEPGIGGGGDKKSKKYKNHLVTQGNQVITTKKQAEKNVGKNRKTLLIWVRESHLSMKMLNEYEAKCNDEGIELSSAGYFRYLIIKSSKFKVIAKGVYKIIYADPPWKYQQYGVSASALKHYPVMSIEELCNMELPKIENNAVLFLWTTAPMFKKTFEVIEAWGFEYKAQYVWDKVKHVMGHYNSVRHELLLICTRGNCTLENKKLFDSVQVIEKTKKHSEKPEKFREIIDINYPSGKRIELFARKKVKGWDSWGKDINKDK